MKKQIIKVGVVVTSISIISVMFLTSFKSKSQFTQEDPQNISVGLCDTSGGRIISKTEAIHEIEFYSEVLSSILPHKEARCKVPVSWLVCADNLRSYLDYLEGLPGDHAFVRLYVGAREENEFEPLLVAVPANSQGQDQDYPIANLIHPCPVLCDPQNDLSPFKKAFCNAIPSSERCPLCDGVPRKK